MRMAPHVSSGERILMMAGNFLFRDDDLEKSTSVLSGGDAHDYVSQDFVT